MRLSTFCGLHRDSEQEPFPVLYGAFRLFSSEPVAWMNFEYSTEHFCCWPYEPKKFVLWTLMQFLLSWLFEFQNIWRKVSFGVDFATKSTVLSVFTITLETFPQHRLYYSLPRKLAESLILTLYLACVVIYVEIYFVILLNLSGGICSLIVWFIN
jgi:hypothetical protein